MSEELDKFTELKAEMEKLRTGNVYVQNWQPITYQAVKKYIAALENLNPKHENQNNLIRYCNNILKLMGGMNMTYYYSHTQKKIKSILTFFDGIENLR